MSNERMFIPEIDDQELVPTSKWYMVEGAHRGPACSVGCVYCNQQIFALNERFLRSSGYLEAGYDVAGVAVNDKLYVGKRKIAHIPHDDLINEIKTYLYYKSDTILLFRNHWEPGEDWKSSLELAERCVAELNHVGPVLFITKKPPINDMEVQMMQSFVNNGAKLVVTVSYAGLPDKIEPGGGNDRELGLKKLHEANIPTILSVRPVIQGINDSEEILRMVLNSVGAASDVITYGGLLLDEKVLAGFKLRGYELPQSYYDHQYPRRKAYPDSDIGSLLRRIASDLKLQTPIYPNNGCAIRALLNTRYNDLAPSNLAIWARHGVAPDFETNCKKYCIPEQVAVCEARSKDPETAIECVKSGLMRLGREELEVVTSKYNAGLLLLLNGDLVSTQLFYLDRLSGWRVDNLPTRETLEYRINQALKSFVGLSDCNVVGSCLLEEEWIVLLSDNASVINPDVLNDRIRWAVRGRVSAFLESQLRNEEFRKDCAESLENKFYGNLSCDRILSVLNSLAENKNV